MLLAGLAAGIVTCLVLAWRLHRSIVVRAGLVLASVVQGVLAYDVARGYDYSVVIATYHALAGPLLTFTSLALALLLLWRVIVAVPLRRRPPRPRELDVRRGPVGDCPRARTGRRRHPGRPRGLPRRRR